MRHIGLVLAVAGCGWSEDRFLVDGVDALCAEISACTGHVPVDACVDAVRVVDRAPCDYDGAAARDCAADVADAVCLLDANTGRSSLELPATCAEVYPDCAPLYEEPYDPAF